MPLPVLRGRLNILEARGAGAWCGAPQIMEVVEVVQHVPNAGALIVVCQCHRSCRYVEVASFHCVLPQVQFLD